MARCSDGQAIGTRSEGGAAGQFDLAHAARFARSVRRSRRALHGQHGPGPVVNQVDPSGRITQVLGQGRVLVGRLAAGDQGRQSGLLGSVKAVQHQQIHGRTLTRRVTRTRYLGPVGRPRTPKGRARVVSTRLAEVYPGTAAELCALDFDTPFQLLAATILSAQCTDARVNMVTPALFAAYPDAAALAACRPRARGGAHPHHRILPGQDKQSHRHGRGGGRPLRRRRADRARRSGHHARGGSQDGQRGAQRGLRAPGPPRRHPCAAPQRTIGPH